MITFQAMFPVMVTNKLSEQNDFYQRVLGFDAVFFEPDFYLHLVSPSTGVQLGFLMPNHPSQPKFLRPMMLSEGYAISIEVPDITQALEQAKKLSLNITLPLTQEDWGQTHFMIKDPAGFYIDIIQHVDIV